MRNRPLIVLAAGLALLLVLAILGIAGVRVMPSYLSAWLFALSIPAGALLLVTGLEMLASDTPRAPDGVPEPGTGPDAGQPPVLVTILPSLRALLPLLPVVAVCGLPILLLSPTLYDPDAWPAAGIGRSWFTHGLFSVRMVLFLLVWSGLALLFSVPAPRASRRGVAGVAFGLTLVIGTLAAWDWAMAVEPDLASSSFGLLWLSGQAVSAIAVATLVASPLIAARNFALPMLILLSVWLFLHFSQFLVIWSADKPNEVVWYLHRIGGLGGAALWLGALTFILALALLLPRGRVTRNGPVLVVAGLVLFVRLIESFWLITPAFRGTFTITIADLLATAGLVAITIGVQLGGWLPVQGRQRHVTA